MSGFFEKIMPNVVAYWDRFTTSCWQTLQMFAIAGVFTFKVVKTAHRHFVFG